MIIVAVIVLSYIEENSSFHVGPSNNKIVDEMARGFMEFGVKYKDACHVASAIIAGCDYLISTDKRLLKCQNDKIKLINPIEFIEIMEEKYER